MLATANQKCIVKIEIIHCLWLWRSSSNHNSHQLTLSKGCPLSMDICILNHSWFFNISPKISYINHIMSKWSFHLCSRWRHITFFTRVAYFRTMINRSFTAGLVSVYCQRSRWLIRSNCFSFFKNFTKSLAFIYRT